MAAPGVLAQSLLGQTLSVPLVFGKCPATTTDYVWQPFIVNDKLVSLSAKDCGVDLQRFSQMSNTKLWYKYETGAVSERLPIQAYVHADVRHGDAFHFEATTCDYSLSATAHTLPSGVGTLKLLDKSGNSKWQGEVSGNIGDTCLISISSLEGALGFWPNKQEPEIILPEEQWHSFVSLIFVVLGLVYLVGDMGILQNSEYNGVAANPMEASSKLFLLDGPLTALATSVSIVVNEARSFAENWVLVQQSVLLSGVVANFTMLFFILYLRSEKVKWNPKILLMYVEIPIFIAILIPVMHSAGNLLELACVIACAMTVFVANRHLTQYVPDEPDDFKLVHRLIAYYNILIISPTILLTIVHPEVGGGILRVVVSLAITLAGVAASKVATDTTANGKGI